MKICRGGFASLIREMCCLTLLHSSALCSWSEQDHRVLSPRNWLHSSWEYLFRLDLESRVSFECSSTWTAAHFQFSNVSLALGVSPSQYIQFPVPSTEPSYKYQSQNWLLRQMFVHSIKLGKSQHFLWKHFWWSWTKNTFTL